LNSSIRAGQSNFSWIIETRSIISRNPRTTAPQSMPTEPSSLAGFTINGNSRSSTWSSFPRKLLAKRGVRMEWKWPELPCSKAEAAVRDSGHAAAPGGRHLRALPRALFEAPGAPHESDQGAGAVAAGAARQLG